MSFDTTDDANHGEGNLAGQRQAQDRKTNGADGKRRRFLSAKIGRIQEKTPNGGRAGIGAYGVAVGIRL